MIKLPNKRPLWHDHCGHGLDCFLGSIEVIHFVGDGKPRIHERYDVYVDGDHVCLRYGREPSEYASPSAESLLYSVGRGGRGSQVYTDAYHLIQESHTPRFIKVREPKPGDVT